MSGYFEISPTLSNSRPVFLVCENDDTRLELLTSRLRHQSVTVGITTALPLPGTLRTGLEREVLIVIPSWRQGQAHDVISVSQGIRQLGYRSPIILMAKSSSESHAIAALRAGVNDYFGPTDSVEAVANGVRAVLARQRALKGNRGQQSDSDYSLDCERLLGSSSALQVVKKAIVRLAKTDSTVLITGETGTGKELAAELIHQNSQRKEKPFVPLNCAAIPEGLIESELFGHERGAFTGAINSRSGALKEADEGTLFLDEVGDMSLAAQAKMLRVVETKRVTPIGGHVGKYVDTRIIAATNQPLKTLVAQSRFRADLFHRLCVTTIELPALRERREDIPMLVQFFTEHFNQQLDLQIQGCSDAVLQLFLQYSWPGNIRELRNVIEATLINTERSCFGIEDLPCSFLGQIEQGSDQHHSEKDRLLSALMEAGGNKSKAAQALQCSRMTVYRKLARHGLNAR